MSKLDMAEKGFLERLGCQFNLTEKGIYRLNRNHPSYPPSLEIKTLEDLMNFIDEYGIDRKTLVSSDGPEIEILNIFRG
jgi:predicted TIM-barrel fold metal-dependent hydrolase